MQPTDNRFKARDNDPVNVAVIGAGLIGEKHARLAAELPGCRLVGIGDPNPAVGRLGEMLGVPVFGDVEALAAATDPEGVIIATPTDRHVAVGIACADRGLHLFVEKPIAADEASARKLIARARERRVRLLVGHHRRFNPLVEAARETVQAGRIGRLVAVSALWTLLKPRDYFEVAWRTQPGAGPALINLIHDMDCLRYICGEIHRVHAEVSSAVRGLAVEDTAGVTLRFSNGALGTALISDCVPSKWSYEATTGENPYYFRTNENCYLFFGTEGSLAFPSMERIAYPSASRSGWQHPLVSERVPVAEAEADPLARQLEHFCAVIRGRETPRTDGEDALRTLAATRAVLASGASGKPVDLAFN